MSLSSIAVRGFAVALCFAAVTVHAQPSLDEYKDVKPGLMMPEVSAPTATHDSDIKVVTVGQGSQRAMTMEEIVTLYRKGEFAQAAALIKPFADNGQHQAEELLGIMYRMGQGVDKNPEEALVLLNKAALAFRPRAMHHIGISYYTGEGVTQDPTRGLMWVHLATLYYPDGAEKTRAMQDRDNIRAQLSRRDRDRSLELAREWLIHQNENHMVDRLQQ